MYIFSRLFPATAVLIYQNRSKIETVSQIYTVTFCRPQPKCSFFAIIQLVHAKTDAHTHTHAHTLSI